MKKPRKTCELLLCSHSPPNLTACFPASTENASRTWTRLKVSSTQGSRKNGAPKRNVVLNPMAVSAGTLESTAARGRSSREKLTCASFTCLAEKVLNRLKLTELILEG